MIDEESVAVKISSLPLPAEPQGEAQDYVLPTDPDSLTDIRLGQEMLRLAAWRGFAKRIVGQLDAELTTAEAHYKAVYHYRAVAQREKLGKAANGDTVEAFLMAEDEELRLEAERILALKVLKLRVTTREEIYAAFFAALSREQSRRMERNKI